MSVLFYDNVGTGHHRGYVAGIVAAAEKRGLPFLAAATEIPSTLSDPGRWIEVEAAPLRSVMANRRQLTLATKRAVELGGSSLIDLYLDQQIWAITNANKLGVNVHVLHHGEQYSRGDRSGVAGLRTRYARHRLRSLVRSGAAIVVHNDRTAEILSSVVPPERLIRAGFPVHPLSTLRPPGSGSRPRAIFVGAGRREKGLDLLFEALAEQPDLVELRIVGRQPGTLREELTSRYPAVAATWADEFVNDETLHDEYRGAHLAILPYRGSFRRHGGPSSVLLETLSAGLPIVTTTALVDQLPMAYGGALVAAADSAPLLAEAIRSAVDRLDTMAASASASGPKFIAEHHTFDRYLDHLMSAIEVADG